MRFSPEPIRMSYRADWNKLRPAPDQLGTDSDKLQAGRDELPG